VAEPFRVTERKAVIDDAHAHVPALSLAWKIPARRTPDFYAIALLKSILCDGESARLYQRLVKDWAVCIEVQGTLEARRGPGQVAVFAIHKPDAKADDVRTIIEAEIGRIKSEGVSADELTKVKNQFRLDRFLSGSEGEYSSLQTALGRALALGEFAMFDGDPALINTDISSYLAVTAEQIRDVARKYFVPENTSVLDIRAIAGQSQPAEVTTRKR